MAPIVSTRSREINAWSGRGSQICSVCDESMGRRSSALLHRLGGRRSLAGSAIRAIDCNDPPATGGHADRRVLRICGAGSACGTDSGVAGRRLGVGAFGGAVRPGRQGRSRRRPRPAVSGGDGRDRRDRRPLDLVLRPGSDRLGRGMGGDAAPLGNRPAVGQSAPVDALRRRAERKSA